jgi:hypothetical protein
MPGLAKVRRAAIAARRSVELLGLRGGWFSSMVENADIVSEGAVQVVDGVEGYFGSTSLRCRVALDKGESHDGAGLAQLVVTDPNARLRLLRLAHREAVSRASRSLGVLTAEITATNIDEEQGGYAVVAIDIDVSAALLDPHVLSVDNG